MTKKIPKPPHTARCMWCDQVSDDCYRVYSWSACSDCLVRALMGEPMPYLRGDEDVRADPRV